MPTCSIEQAEAVRRYCAAFPALTKDETSLQYCLPPPAWCKKEPVIMQCHELSKDWKKKIPTGKERRNSYQGQRKNKKRCNSYSRSFESKESLPEWVTHEGIWDMETQDPVREFIRAIALDEGYGTCENTVTDDMQDIRAVEPRIRAVPEWDDGLDLAGQWVITDEPPPRPLSPSDEELYARFEAKFDRSIEALWARDQNTPDDDYQELPIDFAELLASPSDQLFGAPPPPPPLRFASVISPPSLSSLPSLADSVWACDAPGSPPLHDRLRPLHLASPPPRPPPPPPPPPELESFALYDGDELYDALSTVANTVRSLTAINHSRDTSGFCEVPPRRRATQPAIVASPPPRRDVETESEREDLLTAARTHFRPIEREPEAEAPRYADGDTFDIRSEPDVIEYRRSASGGAYIGAGLYLECRGAPAPLRFEVKQQDTGVQTEAAACDECASQAKKMRPAGSNTCLTCAPVVTPLSPPPTDEMSRDWEELLADISAAHAHYVAAPTVESEEGGADRKRRHSAALRCARQCAHPHARFLPCHALDRPLTR